MTINRKFAFLLGVLATLVAVRLFDEFVGRPCEERLVIAQSNLQYMREHRDYWITTACDLARKQGLQGLRDMDGGMLYFTLGDRLARPDSSAVRGDGGTDDK